MTNPAAADYRYSTAAAIPSAFSCARPVPVRSPRARPSAVPPVNRSIVIDEYEFVRHPRLASHGPTLFAGLSRHVDVKLARRPRTTDAAARVRGTDPAAELAGRSTALRRPVEQWSDAVVDELAHHQCGVGPFHPRDREDLPGDPIEVVGVAGDDLNQEVNRAGDALHL